MLDGEKPQQQSVDDEGRDRKNSFVGINGLGNKHVADKTYRVQECAEEDEVRDQSVEERRDSGHCLYSFRNGSVFGPRFEVQGLSFARTIGKCHSGVKCYSPYHRRERKAEVKEKVAATYEAAAPARW